MTHPMPSDELCAKVSASVPRALATMVEADAESYNRQRDLIDKKLLALWPKEANDYSIPGTEHLIKRVQKVVRATYRMALIHPHHYSVSRHIALLTALKAEQARLKHLIAERRQACAEAAE